jgi:hypothetical protein
MDSVISSRITEFNASLTDIFKRELMKKTSGLEKFYSTNYGWISTKRMSTKTFNEDYLDSLIQNQDIANEVYITIKNLMIAFHYSPTNTHKFTQLYHGSVDDIDSVRDRRKKFDYMLSTTTQERVAGRFIKKFKCCKYVFLFNNRPDIPYIDINTILNTPFNDQFEILLPPNLSGFPTDPPRRYYSVGLDTVTNNIIDRNQMGLHKYSIYLNLTM